MQCSDNRGAGTYAYGVQGYIYSASQKKRNDCHVRKNGAEKRPEKVAHKSFTGEFCDSLAFVYDRLVSLTDNLQLLGLQNLTAMPLRSKLKHSTIWAL